MNAQTYFSTSSSMKRNYDALRDFYQQGLKAEDISKKYGYTLSSFYSLSRDFTKHLKTGSGDDFFFRKTVKGRKPKSNTDQLDDLIISLRKQNHSIEDIVIMGY